VLSTNLAGILNVTWGWICVDLWDRGGGVARDRGHNPDVGDNLLDGECGQCALSDEGNSGEGSNEAEQHVDVDEVSLWK
jgi:hypothetical protein